MKHKLKTLPVEVVFEPQQDFGEYFHNGGITPRIVLDSRQSRRSMMITAFHELCHAVLRRTGWSGVFPDGREEDFVEMLEQNLYPAWEELRTVVEHELDRVSKK